MAEITFEKFALALEAARGTAEAAPTHVFPMSGTLDPAKSRYKPEDMSRGLLAGRKRSKPVREWADWSADGGLDTYIAPVFAHMALQPGVTPTQPDLPNAPNTYNWDFVRVMTQNTLKTGTFWWGDPNVQILQSAFALLKEWTITADGTGEDGVTHAVSGVAAFPTKVATPAYPADDYDSLIVPMDLEVWLDTAANPIGTTQLLGRCLYVAHTIPTGLQEKFRPQGPGNPRTYDKAGVQMTVPTTTIRFELEDMAQYDLFANDTYVKLRVRHNGDLIESGGGNDYYEYVQIDGYGYFEGLSWGEFEATNRTVEFTLEHEYEATLGSDLAMQIQNARSTL